MALLQSLRTRERDNVAGDVFTARKDPVINLPTARTNRFGNSITGDIATASQTSVGEILTGGKNVLGLCNSNWSACSNANRVSNLSKQKDNLVHGGRQSSGLTTKDITHELESIQEAISPDSLDDLKSCRPVKLENRNPLDEHFLTDAREQLCVKFIESWPALPSFGSQNHIQTNISQVSNRSLEFENKEHGCWLKAVRPHCPESLAGENWPSLSEAGTSLEVFGNVAFPAGSGKVCTDVVPSFSCVGKGGSIHREDFHQKHNNCTNSYSLSRSTGGWNSNAICEYPASQLQGPVEKQKHTLPLVLGSKKCNQASDRRRTTSKASYTTEGMFNTNFKHNFNPQPMPAVFLMLNTDFIVASPLKENLLLTLALAQKSSGDPQGRISKCEANMKVLVGQFRAFSSFLRVRLGHDARRVATESNAGGTSTISESLSVEYFVRRFQAQNVITEMEVEYCSANWKKVDYICNLYGQKVGVSVTRAMSYPNPEEFSPQMACRLLYKKLYGLVVARHGVTSRHSFSRCILHVWCETQKTAKIMESEYKEVAKELDVIDNVIMILTVAEGWHARSIFYESCVEK